MHSLACHKTRQIAIPAESTLAIQTRTAQMQDKVEQQHLKRLVLNYEQREEAEELKGEHGPMNSHISQDAHAFSQHWKLAVVRLASS